MLSLKLLGSWELGDLRMVCHRILWTVSSCLCRFDFCSEKTMKRPSENLGQVLFGERIEPSPYKVTCAYAHTQNWCHVNVMVDQSNKTIVICSETVCKEMTCETINLWFWIELLLLVLLLYYISYFMNNSHWWQWSQQHLWSPVIVIGLLGLSSVWTSVIDIINVSDTVRQKATFFFFSPNESWLYSMCIQKFCTFGRKHNSCKQ